MLSKAQQFLLLTEEEQNDFINSLSSEELNMLLYEWSWWGRPEQQIDFTDDFYSILFLAGRGAGKTRTGSEFIIKAAMEYPGCHIAIIGKTQKDVRTINVADGDSSILKVSPPWFVPEYKKNDSQLRWPNGSYATIYSDEQREALRGPQHHFAVCDEIAKWQYLEETMSNLDFTMRLGKKPKILITTTPKNLPYLKKLMNEPKTKVIRGTTFDNAQNLAPTFLQNILDTYGNSKFGRQEIYAEILDQIDGALWKYEDIIHLKADERPNNFDKIAVGVDVAVSNNKNSDETGIVIVGLKDGKAYVIGDETDKYSPNEFSTKLINIHDKFREITPIIEFIVERNQGGTFLENSIRLTEKNLKRENLLKITTIFSSKSKMERAEGIYLLYEQQKVFHVGYLGDLESELFNFTEEAKFSPNRLDALGFALNHLIVNKVTTKRIQNNLWK